MREIPAHDFPRAAVDHAHQISPTHRRTCPDLGHVRLPDLIGPACFHTPPFFPATSTKTPRAHQQPAFSHHPQHTLPIHRQSFLPLQPPSHASIAIRQFF